MSFLVINGVRTHYQRVPAKEAPTLPAPQVVFVHGLGYDSLASFYLTLAPPFAAAGIDVLTYDLRAHGRSDRPSRGYRLEDFTSDLRELLDGIGVTGPVHLVGNSFGGTVAFAFAARYPERVRSIVAIESEPPTAAWSEKMARALNAVLDEMEAERFLAWVSDTYGQHHARLTLSAAEIIRATSIIEDVPSGPFLEETALAAFTHPVLSVLGSEGFQSEDLHGVERLLPRCRTEVIAGQDHSVLVERHHELRPLLLDWIARHEPAMSGGSR
ncbi:alpha/beta hydrolase [Pseudonocardia sp. DSM 110487]|uniref:alpha/beta fold hydrolase n=1 Tax=Pseudonocardia sp. DSM 110487 TaxID=2865833 RepID=UPI001C6A4ED4|nr:alpha/beta hydrolase [Pseudonocardia sp. DSM 110487]QYN38780.1 alpha/beta hydrolase [Pseudonocardia sp. DSM 110487]